MKKRLEIPVIAGDGSGEDIWNASHPVLEEAVLKGSGGSMEIGWIPLLAGQKALDSVGELLPEKTLETIRERKVAIKGPLTTPVGGGFRSVNVYLRQFFDLYVCLRPVRYFKGLPSPLKAPEAVDLIILRENTEDIYRGIEWGAGTPEARAMLTFLREKMDVVLPDDTGIGVKPMSRSATARFTRWALKYGVAQGRKKFTVVHKGNIMKHTEGAFREWVFETAREFPESVSVEGEEGKIIVNDRIADNMFMQVILSPGDFDVLLCPNLNGDYLSDACVALIGGLGVAPGANIGDETAIFEPTHGTAPEFAGLDVINPISFLLSGAMMFDHLGLTVAGDLVRKGIEAAVRDGFMTYDLARQLNGIRPVKCSTFGEEVAKRIGAL